MAWPLPGMQDSQLQPATTHSLTGLTPTAARGQCLNRTNPIHISPPITSPWCAARSHVVLQASGWSVVVLLLSERCKGISDLTFSFKLHNSTQTTINTNTQTPSPNTAARSTAVSSIANLCNHAPPPNASTSCSMHACTLCSTSQRSPSPLTAKRCPPALAELLRMASANCSWYFHTTLSNLQVRGVVLDHV